MATLQSASSQEVALTIDDEPGELAGFSKVVSGHRKDWSQRLATSMCMRDTSSKPKGMFVSFKDLTYTVFVSKGCFKPREPKVLLQNVRGHFNPGEMTALMGPSGSGKTTLLDVISGRKSTGQIEGDIKYGIDPPSQSFLRRHTGYVEQFDTLVDNLTVYDMLLYTAEMKLVHTMSLEEKRQRVEEVIDKLQMHSCRDTIIGNAMRKGISGGQAKRVNIGVSIITEPLVLYLDEPTSGLDSFTSDEVMTFVQKLSMDGMCVCATIHSPSPTTFSLFDRLMLLVGGRVVYNGRNGEHCIDYFRSSGLAKDMPPVQNGREAEWVVQLITDAGNHGRRDEFADTFNASAICRAHDLEELGIQEAFKDLNATGMLTVAAFEKNDPRRGKATTVPTWYALRKLFYYRTLRNYKDGMFLSARVVDKVICIGIICSLFRAMGNSQDLTSQQSTAAALFMWATQPAFGAASYLPTIMMERALYQRERNDGLYYSWSYYISKWIQELLLAVPFSALFCIIVWGAVRLSGNFVIFWLAFLAALLTSIATAFTFGTLCPTLEFANGAVPSFGGTLLFFVGYLIPLNNIPGWWIWYSYFDYLRFPYVTMMINQFKHTATPYECQGESYSGILEYYGMQDEILGMNLPVAFGWWIFYTLSALAVLKLIRWGAR